MVLDCRLQLLLRRGVEECQALLLYLALVLLALVLRRHLLEPEACEEGEA